MDAEIEHKSSGMGVTGLKCLIAFILRHGWRVRGVCVCVCVFNSHFIPWDHFSAWSNCFLISTN